MALEIRIEETGPINRPCTTCGEWFEPYYVAGHVYEDDEPGGWYCKACLEAGPLGIRDRMRDHATRLEELAAELRQAADGAIDMPNLNVYTAMRDEAEAAAEADLGAGWDDVYAVPEDDVNRDLDSAEASKLWPDSIPPRDSDSD